MKRAFATVVLSLLVLAVPPPAPRAGEARERGRNATVTFIDEKGERKEVAGKNLRYGYFTRVYLKIPKNGRNYRDEERQDKGLPFAEDFLRFSTMGRADFARENDAETGAARLVIKITFVDGRIRMGRATTLAGATHPSSPYVRFEVDGTERRLELLPLTPEDQRRGKAQIVSLDFSL